MLDPGLVSDEPEPLVDQEARDCSGVHDLPSDFPPNPKDRPMGCRTHDTRGIKNEAGWNGASNESGRNSAVSLGSQQWEVKYTRLNVPPFTEAAKLAGSSSRSWKCPW